MSIKVRKQKQLNEQFGNREYDISEIVRKIRYVILKVLYPKFCESNGNKGFQVKDFAKWIEDNYFKTYVAKDGEKLKVACIGKFQINDFYIKVYFRNFEMRGNGCFAPGESNIDERLGIVFLDIESIIYSIFKKTDDISHNLEHELRHVENYINKWNKKLFDNDVPLDAFSYSDDKICLVCYYLYKEEMSAYNNNFNGYFQKIFDVNNFGCFIKMMKNYSLKSHKLVKCKSLSDLLFQKTDNNSNVLFDILSYNIPIFNRYFVGVNNVMKDYVSFRKYIVDAIDSYKEKDVEFAYWFFSIMNNQLVSKKKQEKLEKVMDSYITKKVMNGNDYNSSLIEFVEGVYLEKLYDVLSVTYSTYKSKIVSMLLKYVNDFEKMKNSKTIFSYGMMKYYESLKK